MIINSKKIQRISVSILYFLLLIVSFSASAADQSMLRINKAVQNLQSKAVGNVSYSYAANSPYVSFLKVDQKSPIQDDAAFILPLDRAKNFLQNQKNAFIDTDTQLELVEEKIINSNQQQAVRMQQLYNGVPVRGGEVLVNLNKLGITAVNSNLVADLKNINIIPDISAEQALNAAKKIIFSLYGNRDVSYSYPQLEIFNESVLTAKSAVSRLSWFIEARGLTLREYIWINTVDGKLNGHISQFARLHGKVRDTFDVAGADNFNGLITADLTELILVYGVPTVQAAHDLAGTAYDYYLTILGRDGLVDALGLQKTITSYANIGNTFTGFVQSIPPAPFLPLTVELAGWNGSKMLYAANYTVDDIVGHEYTHAVIEQTANFLLTRESGALAESFADILGEAIDLSDANSSDTAGDVRWDIGENSPSGTLRNLLTPGSTANASGVSFPGKVTDTNYYCGTDNDLYIHKNSTVLSHAFALAVDGGTFNGVVINAVDPDQAISLDKVAKIYYNALTNLLSNNVFIDAYNTIIASATTAVALGDITSAGKKSIEDALNAVELNVVPCVTPKIPYCPTGQLAQFAFQDDFENPGTGNWGSSAITGANHWNGGLGVSPSDVYHTGIDALASVEIARQGNNALYGDGTRRLGGSEVSMNNNVAIGVDYRVQFEHNFAFENTEADGGYFEYSANGGPWFDAGFLITSGVDYTLNKTISAAGTNPFAGHAGFLNFMSEDAMSNPLYDYASTQLDLNLISPTPASIRFRFLVGTDSFTDARGWVIDEFAIYTCIPQVFKVNQGSAPLTTNETGIDTALFSVTLESQPAGTVTISLLSDTPTEGIVTQPGDKVLTFTPANWDSPHLVTVIGQDDSVVDGDIVYTIQLEGAAADPLDSRYNGVSVNISITNADDGEVTRGGGGGGGCSVSTQVGFDPGLPLMVLLSLLYLYRKRKTRVIR